MFYKSQNNVFVSNINYLLFVNTCMNISSLPKNLLTVYQILLYSEWKLISYIYKVYSWEKDNFTGDIVLQNFNIPILGLCLLISRTNVTVDMWCPSYILTYQEHVNSLKNIWWIFVQLQLQIMQCCYIKLVELSWTVFIGGLCSCLLLICVTELFFIKS